MKSSITVICGHYGCGKTNLVLNLAAEAAQRGRRSVVVDMDVVNPYFRSSDYSALLKKLGVELIAPVFANTTLDTPVLRRRSSPSLIWRRRYFYRCGR